MRIDINDVRSAGFCVIGARSWFERHGMSFNDFLREGIDADEFMLRGDDLAKMVVEAKVAANG